METPVAAVIGATGLIGRHLVELLQTDGYYRAVRALVRRPVVFNSPKVQVIVVDFADPDTFKRAIAGSHAVFCAVGTTRQKVKGDEVAYRKVDYDIPVNAARFCGESGCPHFLLVSSVGANAQSSNFYLRLKGEVEETIGRMNIPSISIFRPSMLLGKREESRRGETIAQAIFKPLALLFPSNYRPIAARDVARAMIAASKRDVTGHCVYHYREMMAL